MAHLIPVLVQTPAHSQIGGALTYRSESPLTPGTLVRVPLGRRETLGVVWCPAEGVVGDNRLVAVVGGGHDEGGEGMVNDKW